jgi:hypothetical protein
MRVGSDAEHVGAETTRPTGGVVLELTTNRRCVVEIE